MQLQQKITGMIGYEGMEIDMMKLLANSALELIGQGGLGYSFEKEARDDKKMSYGKAIHAIL